MNVSNALRGNAVVVITGASRGIGKEIALQFGQTFSDTDSVFFLLSRNEGALNEVKELILKETLSVEVELLIEDLSNPDLNVGTISERIRNVEKRRGFDLFLIVHNAATVGDITKRSSELNDQNDWHSYLQMNLVSTISLNNQIYSSIKKETKKSITIVNITSLLAVNAFPAFAQYSVGKAARDAYFRAFAVENQNAKILNYSPGPVDTQMHQEVAERAYDSDVREIFSRRRESKLHRKLLSPAETVKCLLRILSENKFASGDRIDYFDINDT